MRCADDDSGSDDDDKAGGAGEAAPQQQRQHAKPAGPPVLELPPLPELDISDAEKMELVGLLQKP